MSEQFSSIEGMSHSAPRPRGLTIEQAAKFAGLSRPRFKKACEAGEYPRATLPGGRIDMKKLEQAMDRLSGISSGNENDALAEWELRRRES